MSCFCDHSDCVATATWRSRYRNHWDIAVDVVACPAHAAELLTDVRRIPGSFMTFDRLGSVVEHSAPAQTN